ncbi:MAG: hypothetical protein R3E63_09960 [Pseudomonadales bacterium]
MTDDKTTDPRDAGMRAFFKSDFTQAFTLLLPCANAGDTHAQMLIARMYYAGNGVSKNMDQYQYWLERAAEGGDKSARARLKRLKHLITK